MNRLTALAALSMLAACGEAPSTNETATFWTYDRTADLVRGGNSVTAMTEGRLNGDEFDAIADPATVMMRIERVAGQPDTGTLEASCHPSGKVLLRVDQAPPVTIPCIVTDTSMGPLSSGYPTFGADVVAQIAESDNVYVELRGGSRPAQYVFYTGGLNLSGE